MLGGLFKIEGRSFRARGSPESIFGAKMEPKPRSETQKIDTKIDAKIYRRIHQFFIDVGPRFGIVSGVFLGIFWHRFWNEFLLRKNARRVKKHEYPTRCAGLGWRI